MTKITDNSHKDRCAFMIYPRWILLRMRNVADRSCRESQKTHFMLVSFFSRKSCRLWDNVGKYCRAAQVTDDKIIWRMRFACWITKAADTHVKYVILIVFFFHGHSDCTNARHCYIILVRTLAELSLAILLTVTINFINL